MDLKLNISKKGLSTTEEVINEEYTLHYGHIFRGKSAYQYAIESGLFNGTEEEFEAYVGNIGKLSEEAKLAIVEAREAAKNANEMANTANTAAGNADNATISANNATKKAEAATTATTTAIAEANSAATDARTATTRANTAAERANAAAANAEQYEEKLDAKQDNLVSGENIKTINGESILGEGNIIITNYPSTNEIWYYADEQILAQEFDGIFDANIISHKYSNNRGVLKFDGEVSRINGDFPFIASSVLLPASITYIEDFAFGSINTVYVNAPNPPSIGGDYTFSSVVYVPINSFDKYESEWEGNMNDWQIKGVVFPDEFVVIDTEISETSTNAVTNKAVAKALQEKVSKVEGKGLSTNDFTDEYKKKVEEFTIDKELSATSDNAIANSAVVKGLAELAEGVSTAIGQVSESFNAELEKKANTKGYYPDMSVGMADNLVGRGDVQDAQINFRPSAGADNITDAAARVERIKGNSVVWNQLLSNADFRDGTQSWVGGSATIKKENDYILWAVSASSPLLYQNVSWAANHKLLILVDFQRLSDINVRYAVYLKHKNAEIYDTCIATEFSSLKRETQIVMLTSTSEIESLYIYPYFGTIEKGTQAKFYSIRAIDLTKMFGADNEPTTVEEYYQRKPMNIEDEFTYNEGELIDMKVNSLISTSDNAFNPLTLTARVMGGYKYDITANEGTTLVVSFYADGEDPNEEREIAPDSEGKYIFPATGTCYVNGDPDPVSGICVCLNHSYTKPHPAYQQVIKDLSFINEAFIEGMRSAGSAFDEIRFNPTKKVWEKVTRIGVVDLGSLSWEFAYGQFQTSLNSAKGYNVLCPIYAAGDGDKEIRLHSSLVGYVFVKDSSYTDATTFKQAMQGVMCYYELATPIVEEIDLSPNFNLDYFAWDFGTEEAIASVPSAPFRADINYEPNAVDDLRWAVSEIRNLRAELAQLQSAQASETNLTE